MRFLLQRPGFLLALLFIFFSTPNSRAEAVLRVVKEASSGVELLTNGGFELGTGGKPTSWEPGPKGFVLAAGEGRSGSRGLHCRNSESKGWYGGSQTIILNRTNVLPLVVRGWSKAFEVAGSSDNDYSLYLDLVYTDGAPLWGQTANFQTGTHDWQERQLMVLPEKPVKSITVYCLFRNHSGRVCFDDISLTELRTQSDAVLFQGVPVVPSKTQIPASPLKGPSLHVATQDGLALTLQDGAVTSLNVAGLDLAIPGPSGFLVRDVKARSDFFRFEGGVCPELGLSLQCQFRNAADHIEVSGRLSDTRSTDRAVTLVFALPVDARGWRWGDDIHQSRIIGGSGEFSKTVNIKCGATGTMSLYPLAALTGDKTGLAIALDMSHPAQYRLGYHAGTRQLFIAYDFGLTKETDRFPSSADFRFVLYRFSPEWGFRAAFQKLMTIFPNYFAVRSKDQGLWMPFTDVATVQGWEDFGFKYHEGNNAVGWDDAHGVLSFRYTEPMTWWMKMSGEAPRTLSEAEHTRDILASGSNLSERRMAEVARSASMWDESGNPCLLFRNEPWCNGAVWSLNPNPWLGSPFTNTQTRVVYETNAATLYWNDDISRSLYGAGAKGQLDGEYLDSLEGYVSADLNFRREHFRYSTVPLTFATDSGQPALFKGLAVFEFTRWFCDHVHNLGKLTFANGVPYRFTYLCPWLDVMGTETDWLNNHNYSPASHEQMSLWRTLSGAKPYLLLMNTDFDVFTPDMVERYFQRSLFYGMFPGMFSHDAADNPYWQNPKWYNRDRSLFKRYMPVIREVAEAGWRPIPDARCDNSRVLLERFGPNPAGQTFLTIFNDSDTSQTGRMQIDWAALGLTRPGSIRELFSLDQFKPPEAPQLTLAPQETKVLEMTP